MSDETRHDRIIAEWWPTCATVWGGGPMQDDELRSLRWLSADVERATLASLLPEGEVLEAGLDAGLRNGLYAQTSLVEANDHFKNDLRIFLRAAAPILLADKEREIEELKGELEQADKDVDAARFGQTYTDKLYGKVCEERDALTSRVAALEGALKEAVKLCWCGGTGRIYVDGNMYDPCTNATCVKSRAVLGGKPE